jgi:hypothetical protein
LRAWARRGGPPPWRPANAIRKLAKVGYPFHSEIPERRKLELFARFAAI